ncbi:DUF3016 domain-containing protein [Paucibacter sp. R3-3]|uniref:DUF3016 domain-containing protein n=1 Tax=Roseateles agri TaxID=3098619 RepID=A0ABU5DKA3_9BURK|nr:DUF3016 domain-containing protein [Paucibacter sp. R3-3]MDY0746130.1 DUF3016 domain-containing protein [Paucibacter sp. R3-3]
MKIAKTVVMLTLALSGAWVSAAVEVSFVKPDQFIDIEGANFRRQDDYLEALQKHFQKVGETTLPGKDLKIEITDVDLAGRVEPRRNGTDIRILRDRADGPSIQLRYVVSENGVELRRGESRLRDLAYMTGFNSYSDGDPLRYEKRMIDNWFKQEFGPANAK